MPALKLTVDGMSCTGCERTVELAVKNIPNVTSVKADHQAKSVVVEYDAAPPDEKAVKDAISGAGYKPE